MEREIQAASTFDQFVDILQRNEAETQNIIHTITYNPHSQTVFIKLRELLRPEEERLDQSHSRGRSLVTIPDYSEEIKELSRSFSVKFPKLEESFKAWEPHRVELIKQTESCANMLHWNILLGSTSRIFTSAADLFATWKRYVGDESSWSQRILLYAPIVSFVTLFIQATLVSETHESIKNSIKKDEELFEPIKKWFHQSQELDRAIRRFFPYGIDPKIVSEIEQSAEDADENSQIFISIIASNVKNNLGLIKDKDFLGKAEIFSSSETGVKFYRKILIENDPMSIECLKCDLENLLKEIRISNTISKADSAVQGTLLIQSHINISKIVLNGLAMFSDARSIWRADNNTNSELLKKLSIKSKEELEAMKKIYDLLKPS